MCLNNLTRIKFIPLWKPKEVFFVQNLLYFPFVWYYYHRGALCEPLLLHLLKCKIRREIYYEQKCGL